MDGYFVYDKTSHVKENYDMVVVSCLTCAWKQTQNLCKNSSFFSTQASHSGPQNTFYIKKKTF